VRVAVSGVGVVGGFGCGISALEASLASGETAPGSKPVHTGGGEVQLPVFLASTAPLDRFLPAKSLRRIDHFSRLALLGAYLALEDAGALEGPRDRMGVVVGTGYGPGRAYDFLDSVLDDGDVGASPTDFSNSVFNAAAAFVAMFLGIKGPDHTVSQFGMSYPSALLTAVGWLEGGRVDRVLVGGVDQYTAVLGYTWAKFFGVPEPTAMATLDLNRQSAIPGEGATFLLLSREGVGGSPHCYIDGVGQGRMEGGTLALPAESLVVLGAEGHTRCASLYPRLLQPGTEVTAYASHYGSLPVGFGFDLAAACACLRTGRAIPPKRAEGDFGGLRVLREECPLGDRPVSCVRLAERGRYGTATLTRA